MIDKKQNRKCISLTPTMVPKLEKRVKMEMNSAPSFWTLLDPFVPVEADQYAGKSLLCFSRDQLQIDPGIAHFLRHGKLPHSEMRYKRDYTPKEQPEEVEILPQDPSPPELKAVESEPPVNKEPTKRSSCRTKKQPE